MSKAETTKDSYLNAMAEFVLAHGFGEASLRPLAKAAGTSDRMLIYHFGNKELLMSAVIAKLVEQFTEGLDLVLAEVPYPSRRALIVAVLDVVRTEALAPYIRVWQEMTARSAMGDHEHIEAGQLIVQGFVDWLERRMPVDDRDPLGAAKAMLVFIEGVHVMDSVQRGDLVEVALDIYFPDP